MLHAKFLLNHYPGSGEENSQRDFTIYVYGGHISHVTGIMLINVHFHVP